MCDNLDSIDQALLSAIMAVRDSIQEPRVGDYVHFPTGELERFSYKWADALQTSPSGSFYLTDTGASFSGGLNPETPLAKLEKTSIALPGWFWFFHHGRAGAGRGVYFEIPCRVYTTTAAYTGYLGDHFQSAWLQSLKPVLAEKLTSQNTP